MHSTIRRTRTELISSAMARSSPIPKWEARHHSGKEHLYMYLFCKSLTRKHSESGNFKSAALQRGRTEKRFSEGEETLLSIALRGRLALLFILSLTVSVSTGNSSQQARKYYIPSRVWPQTERCIVFTFEPPSPHLYPLLPETKQQQQKNTVGFLK